MYLPWQRDSLVYQLQSRSQSTTGTSLERDEFAGRRCVALPILEQKDEGPSLSLARPPCLAELSETWTLDRRAEAETDHLVLCRFTESLVTDGMTICLMTWSSWTLA